MASKYQLRQGLAANWTSNDPILLSGEIGFETDTAKIKIGDGTTAWTSLAYFAGSGLASLVEDLTPQLGGDLDANSNTITGLDSSTTAKGIVELATIAETDTGTDATRALTSDGLQGSKRNIRYLIISLIDSATDNTATTTIGGDFEIPISGTILQDDTNKELLKATVDTAGVTGTMVIDVHLNGTTIMTTNKLDIETTEKSTVDATTQPDLTTTTVTAGDILTFDVDTIQTTAAKGLKVYLAIREN